MNKKRIRKRSFGREFALKALYLRDIHDGISEKQLELLQQTEGLKEMPEFGRQLINGCLDNMEHLDGIIQKVATNWRLDRMPTLDRNILRLGSYELLFCPETPPVVAINEAIELSKIYGTQDSPNFINGVLDRVYTEFAPRDGSGAGGDSEDMKAPVLTPAERVLKPDPDRRADLHLHTDASDGHLSPAALVEEAKKSGLDAISITDHDSIDGVESAIEAGAKNDLLVVPGVELSAYSMDSEGRREYELHILGYFFDISDKTLSDELKRLRAVRIDRVHRIAAKLSAHGIKIDAEQIIKENYSTVGRLHIALEMVAAGVCRDVGEVFDRYLAAGKPAYVPKEKLTAGRTIELIHGAGGCAVLAHPGFAPGIEKKVDELLQAGLDGIEVHYPEHTPETEAFWMELAKQKDVAVTGGSDFHGDGISSVTIGSETVSFVELSGLLERARRYRTRAERKVLSDSDIIS